MAKLTRLEGGWSLGMKRDLAREQLPSGAAWDLFQLVPDHARGPLRRRGVMSALANDPILMSATRGVYASFGASRYVVIGTAGSGGKLVSVLLANGLVTDISGAWAGGAPSSLTFMNGLAIVCGTSAAAPFKWAGSGSAVALGGSPPGSTLCITWRGYLVLVNGRRIYFSEANKPESWNTADPGGSWVDTRDQIQAIAPIKNTILVFHANTIERIRGTTPPPGSLYDLQIEPLYSEGLDAAGLAQHQVCAYKDNICWISPQGAYMTDGASVSDLTALGGIKTYWQQNYVPSNLGVGSYGDYLVTSFGGGSYLSPIVLVCHLPSRDWVRFEFGSSQSGQLVLVPVQRETYLASEAEAGGTAYLQRLSDAFQGVSGATDANGKVVVPSLETRYYRNPGLGKKRFRHAILGYDLRGSGSQLALSYLTSPESVNYVSLPQLLLSSVAYRRGRVPVRRLADGLALKVQASGPLTDLYLYQLEADMHPVEGSRLYVSVILYSQVKAKFATYADLKAAFSDYGTLARFQP